MAIVKMKRLTLLAMNADKENIYDALVRTNCVQLKRSADIDSLSSVDMSSEREAVLAKIARVEDCIRYVSQVATAFNVTHKRDKDAKVTLPKNSFSRPKAEIDFDYFLSFGQNAEQIEQSLANLSNLKDEVAQLRSLKATKQLDYDKLSLYRALPHPTTWYKDTEFATVQLSQLPSSELTNLHALASRYEMVDCQVIDSNKSTSLVVVIAHKSESAFFDEATALGLVKCNLVSDVLPRVSMEDIERQINGIDEQLHAIDKQIANYASQLAEWKVYVDYLELCDKKLAADGDLQRSASTFVLEGFCPAESEDKVADSIRAVTEDIVLTFYEIGDEEFAPTLTRNNKLTKQFEFVTNSYSVPDYHEVDPNPVMSVFYFIIFGLMVADIGYGLLLLLVGIFAAVAIKQQTGLKTMLQLFGICGISAIAVGALFGSFFSYALYDGIIPDPGQYPMVMMILSLMFGIIHIVAGVGCKMAVCIKHKKHAVAWLTEFPWMIVFVALILAIFNMALDMAAYEPYEVLRLPDMVSKISLYVCLGALVVALIFAGLGTKGFLGKIIKSFSGAYGIINYFSDVMSYIRVFGLMLSSAIMGQVVNQLGGMVMSGGGVGYALAAIVLVVAHLFNLVMGVLSVYIHNGRLQYVEFFGKFYTGDGALFVPFGSDTKYTLVK